MGEKPSNIAGLIIVPLEVISDERGSVLHMLRCESENFSQFGELYFSESNPGAIKAWKRHKNMTQTFAVPSGRIKLVVADTRVNSQTKDVVQEINLGRPNDYNLVKIPPHLWYGFQNTGNTSSLIANLADLPHDPSESETMPLANREISYEW